MPAYALADDDKIKIHNALIWKSKDFLNGPRIVSLSLSNLQMCLIFRKYVKIQVRNLEYEKQDHIDVIITYGMSSCRNAAKSVEFVVFETPRFTHNE